MDDKYAYFISYLVIEPDGTLSSGFATLTRDKPITTRDVKEVMDDINRDGAETGSKITPISINQLPE